MDDTRSYGLQGPHRDMGNELPIGFMPLRLLPEQGGAALAVQAPDVIVGRHTEADIRLPLPDVSRRHCRLVFRNQQWLVQDLNSLNGVFINGERIHEASLYHGDKLQIGSSTLAVEYMAGVSGEELRVKKKDAAEVLQNIAEAIKGQKRAS